MSGQGEERASRWMLCSFEGLAVGARPRTDPDPAVLEETYAEAAAFRVRIVRGRADDIRAAEEPDRQRAGDAFLSLDELPELYVAKTRSVSAQGPEWRAVRVRGARLYDVAQVPLEVDGNVARSAISGTLYFDANDLSLDAGAEDAQAGRKLPDFSGALRTATWFVDPFPPLGCLFDTVALALAVRYGKGCLPAMARFLGAYAALRALRAFAPLASLRARLVKQAERTDFGTAVLWGVWLLTSWLGASAAYVALTTAQEASCAAEGARTMIGTAIAAALLIASPAQRFQAPAIFAFPLVLSGLALTCPAANPVCSVASSGEPRDPFAMPRAGARQAPPRQGAPCEGPAPSAATPSAGGGDLQGALENLRGGDAGASSWVDGLKEQAARLGSAVSGEDSDEHALLEASGAGATRTTLDEAEAGEDPFREAAGIALHGASDTFCGKPLFLASSTLFPAGQATLLPSGQTELRRVARLLVRHADRAFLVAAHVPSEEQGAAEALSKERAQTIAAWLRAWPGLERTALVPLGLGARDGLVDDSGKGAVGRLNDRVEIGLSCGDGTKSNGDAAPKAKKRKRHAP